MSKYKSGANLHAPVHDRIYIEFLIRNRLSFRIKKQIYEKIQQIKNKDKQSDTKIVEQISRKTKTEPVLHIPFPSPEELKTIADRLFDPITGQRISDDLFDAVNDHILDIRKHLNLKKKPATAEILAWFSILQAIDLDTETIVKGLKQNDPDIGDLTEKFKASYTVLAKTNEDLKRMEQYFEKDLQHEGHVLRIIDALNRADY